MVLFRATQRLWGGGGRAKRPPLPKMCYIYSTTMKSGTVIPHLKNIQKMYESRDTPDKFC